MPVRPRFELPPSDANILLGATTAPDGSGGFLGVQVAQMLRAGPTRPRIRNLISDGQIRYSARDPHEKWISYEQAMVKIGENGYVELDCEDIASLVAAEMRVSGPPWQQGPTPDFDPQATVDVYRSAPRTLHVIVDSPRFGRLDPSKTAGM